MTELILSKAARLRQHEDHRVASEYKEMRQAYPTASISRIIESLAASGKFKAKSFFGIRASLIREGIINPQTKA